MQLSPSVTDTRGVGGALELQSLGSFLSTLQWLSLRKLMDSKGSLHFFFALNCAEELPFVLFVLTDCKGFACVSFTTSISARSLLAASDEIEDCAIKGTSVGTLALCRSSPKSILFSFRSAHAPSGLKLSNSASLFCWASAVLPITSQGTCSP